MLNLTVAGFLSSDPKLVEVGQTQVANFSIPARTGPKDEEPTWVKVSVWGNRASTVMSYFQKGSFVTCTGAAKHRPYTSKDGTTGVSLELDATQFTLPVKPQVEELPF